MHLASVAGIRHSAQNAYSSLEWLCTRIYFQFDWFRYFYWLSVFLCAHLRLSQVERFKGFGVVFDTFKNTETLAYHRDVAIVVNDGEKTVELMLEKKEVRC